MIERANVLGEIHVKHLGNAPIHSAIEYGHVEAFDSLREAGRHLNAAYSVAPLRLVEAFARLDGVKKLLYDGADQQNATMDITLLNSIEKLPTLGREMGSLRNRLPGPLGAIHVFVWLFFGLAPESGYSIPCCTHI